MTPRPHPQDANVRPARGCAVMPVPSCLWGIPQCTCGTSNEHPEHARAPGCPACEGTGASQSFLSSVGALPLAWMPQELLSSGPNECHLRAVPHAGPTPRPCSTPILPPSKMLDLRGSKKTALSAISGVNLWSSNLCCTAFCTLCSVLASYSTY
jgi:hypothetical protein